MWYYRFSEEFWLPSLAEEIKMAFFAQPLNDGSRVFQSRDGRAENSVYQADAPHDDCDFEITYGQYRRGVASARFWDHVDEDIEYESVEYVRRGSYPSFKAIC